MIDQAAHDALYDEAFYAYSRDPADRPRHLAMGDVLAEVLDGCHTVFDVGCGSAIFIERLYSLGFDVWGCDGSNHALAAVAPQIRDRVKLWDISAWAGRNVAARLPIDASMCIEVAEHLDAKFADDFINLIAFFAESRIIFSAAPPGQPGTNHVNCQAPAYWLEKFGARGWIPDGMRTPRLRGLMVERFTAHCEYNENFWVLRRR